MDTVSPSPTAELIVRNSRKQGARRALRQPVTIIGSTKGCDVRLEVDSVRPLHCLIAMGSEGPFLRSWAKDTFVNGEAVTTRALEDGDVLRVGPFEFEIKWAAPLAEEVEVPQAMPLEPPALEPAPHSANAEELLRQVNEARAELRRERTEHEQQIARQLEELAETRDTLHRQRREAIEQRNRLDSLRAKFLARWKRHWATRRLQVEAEERQLADGWQKLSGAQAALDSEQERFTTKVTVETKRIEHGWEQLRAAERAFKAEREQFQQAAERQQRALVDEETRQRAEALALRAERMQLEHKSADLRIEADGLESRVVNLRAVLLQLEATRAEIEHRQAVSVEQPPAEPTPDAIGDREAALDRLAEALHEQRVGLAEQVARLAQARELWREEQTGLLNEMNQLAEQLRRREEHIAEDEKAIGFERDQLEHEARELKGLKDRLLARQTRIESVEAGWRSELGRRELLLQARDRELTRREKGLKELCRRWGEHRRAEIPPLNDSRQRCERLALTWIERTTLLEERERNVERREQDSVAKLIAIEKARQKLLNSVPNPELAAKKVERLERQIARRLARSRARDAFAHSTLTEERMSLLELYQRTEELAEQLVARERELNIKRLYWDREELAARQEQARMAEAFEQWRIERDMYERERKDLHDEVERLAGLLLESEDRPTLTIARAA